MENEPKKDFNTHEKFYKDCHDCTIAQLFPRVPSFLSESNEDPDFCRFRSHMYEIFSVYIQMMFGHRRKDEQDQIHDLLMDRMTCGDFHICSDLYLAYCKNHMNDENQVPHLMKQIVKNATYRYTKDFKRDLSNLLASLVSHKFK